jgi:hypothetical protein
MSELIIPGDESSPLPTDDSFAAKIKALKERLGAGAQTLTPEAVEAQSNPDNIEVSPITGKDVNWDDYELDPRYAHFYPKAELVQVGDEMKWIATVQEFHSKSKPINATGIHEKSGEPKGFGEYITWMVNSPEGWRIVAILPGGISEGTVILQRQLRVSLPDPVMVETETVVAAPTDEELAAEEAKGLAWAASQDAENFAKMGDSQTVSQLTGELEVKPTDDPVETQVKFEGLVEGSAVPSKVGVIMKDVDEALKGPDFQMNVTEEGHIEGADFNE